MEPRKRPATIFFLAGPPMLLALLYVASFAPACWLADRMLIHPIIVARAYSPLLKIEPCRRGIAGYPRWLGPLGDAVRWYGDLGAIQNESFVTHLQVWKNVADEVGYANATQFRVRTNRRAEL